MSTPAIYQYNIMILVNYAWSKSFAKIDSKPKAIYKQGWYPYHYHSLTYPASRLIMTKEKIVNEITSVTVTFPQNELVLVTN